MKFGKLKTRIRGHGCESGELAISEELLQVGTLRRFGYRVYDLGCSPIQDEEFDQVLFFGCDAFGFCIKML